MNLHDRLLRSVQNAGADILLREDFNHLGAYDQVARALAQLTREGVLEHVGYGLYARRPKDAEPVLRLEDFGQLARIAWSRKPRSAIAAREALALYERNWRFVEPAAMQRQEKALLKYLVCTYGGGVLHV